MDGDSKKNRRPMLAHDRRVSNATSVDEVTHLLARMLPRNAPQRRCAEPNRGDTGSNRKGPGLKRGSARPNRGGHGTIRGGASTNRGGHEPIRGAHGTIRGGAPTNRGGHGTIRGGASTNRGGHEPIRGAHGMIRGGVSINRGGHEPIRGAHGPIRGGDSMNRGGHEPIRGGHGPIRGVRGPIGQSTTGRSSRQTGQHLHSNKRLPSEFAVITKLETLDDWTNLSKLDNPSRVLTKLQTLESSWVKNLQTEASAEVLGLVFGILVDIGLKYFYAKVDLMKSLFTCEFIMRLVQIVKRFKITWPQEGKDKVLSFIEKLRKNVEFVLSYNADLHKLETSKDAVDRLIDECVDTLRHMRIKLELLLDTPDVDLILETQDVQKLREIQFTEVALVDDALHPVDFRSPCAVDANIVHGAYDSENQYIQTHFSLLKEDFQTVLREGVEQYLADPKTKNFNIWCYENVAIKRSFPWDTNQRKIADRRLLFRVTFPGQKKYLSKIKWKSVKRFMFGSLVVLTADKFNSFHLAVVEDTNFDKPDAIVIIISFIYAPPNGVEDKKFLLVEPKAFYEPYLNSMKVLRRMSEIGLPLKKYIVDAVTDRVLPTYLNPGSVYQIETRDVKVNDIRSWEKVNLGLNPSQKEAFIHALTSEMALIQGPPGTGKTFLAYRMIETLLANHRTSHLGLSGDGPIMVVCYKNHSLDQILEGLLKKGVRVLRIGGSSKNPALQDEYNYRSLKTPRNIHYIVSEQRILQGKLSMCLNKIYKTVNLISLIKAQIGILNFDLLKEFEIVPSGLHLSLENWLLEIEAPQLSLEQIDQKRTAVVNTVGTAYQKSVSSYFKLDLLSASNTLFGYWNTLSEMEEKLAELSEEMMDRFWEINEQYSHVYALYCSLHHCLDIGAVPADVPDGSLPRSVGYSQMELVDRWALYRKWESDLVEKLEIEVEHFQNQVPELVESLSEYDEMIMSLKIKCHGPQVIGVTTTGASKHFSALAGVGAKVVLVEEAAEVLEAHVIASLSNKCQHLILIGDHQQLKPSTATYELATKFHMDVSLFERMINNDMKVSSLSTQHRMRPEIAALICPSIYKNLTNHPSVHEYPNVTGTKKNVYFFDHSHHEESDADSESKSNPQEAEMIAAISHYLLKQGYGPDQITILSTYMEQDRMIKKIIDKKYADTRLKHVLCTVVDNYQGEENIVILLSLVRSNGNGNIGFLKTKNRICVALSRAKHGLFIFGNMACLTMRNSDIWVDVNRILGGQDAISTKFPLKCIRHGNVTEVASPEEVKALKNGGCINPCGTPLPCGHTCRVMCHSSDQEHVKEFACREQCMKKCSNGHTCQAPCQAPCPPCPVMMLKLLVCGHSRNLECHEDNLQSHCIETIETKLELCGHTQLVMCKLTMPSKRNLIVCQSDCEGRFACGHRCRGTCHVLVDPDHKELKCVEPCELINKKCPLDHRCKRKCREPCGDCLVKVKKSLPCGHEVKVVCSVNVGHVKCMKKCSKELPCGHDCANQCVDPCGPCEVKVEKVITECGHKINVSCCDTPTRRDCGQRCKSIKSCGHQCTGKCNKSCAEVFCKTLTNVELPCGHERRVPCGEVQTKRLDFTTECKEPCLATLPCGHHCKGTCGSCLQGRVHLPCDEICDKHLLCNHKCKVRCYDVYHSCTNYKCIKAYWENELTCPPSSHQGRGKRNGGQFDPKIHLANQVQWALIEESGKMLEAARNYSANKTIALQVKQIQLNATKARTLKKNDEQLLTLKTCLFQVEFASIVLTILKRLESCTLPVTKKSELERFLEELVVRSASSHHLGAHEITQLQEQILWVSLNLDVHDVPISNLPPELRNLHSNIKDKMLSWLAATKSSFGPNDREKLTQKLRVFGGSIGISNLVFTDVELKGMFPTADRFCRPIRHHLVDEMQTHEFHNKGEDKKKELAISQITDSQNVVPPGGEKCQPSANDSQRRSSDA